MISVFPRPIFFLGICLVLVLVLYSINAGDYFLFDDIPALERNGLLKVDLSVFDNWRIAIFSSESGPTGRPISMLSFALQYTADGEVIARNIKLGNAFIHCLIGVFLYFLFSEILLSLRDQERIHISVHWTALIGACIWILHPLHVSTVLYAVQRMAQLSALFVVVGLWLFARYRYRWSVHGAAPSEVIVVALWLVLLTGFATLSKENGILLPWLVAVVEFCIFFGRWAGRESTAMKALGLFFFLAPLVLFVATYLLLSDSFHGLYASRDFTVEQRILTQARVMWNYLWWLMLPDISSMSFQHDYFVVSKGWFDPWITWLAVLSGLVLVLVGTLVRKTLPLFSFAVLFFVIAHVTESTFWPLEMVYEHRNYIPGIGICLFMAQLLLLVRFKAFPSARVSIVCAFLLLFAGLLGIRAHSWGDELRMTRDDLARHPDSVRMHYIHGNALLKNYQVRNSLKTHEISETETLALGRHYIEVAHQIDPYDIGALVTLYYLDSVFFPVLGTEETWIKKLIGVLPERTLTATDRNSLVLLAECLGDGSCAAEVEVTDRLSEVLRVHHGGTPEVLQFEYLRLRDADAPALERISILEEAAKKWPQQRLIYRYLIAEYASIEDMDGAHFTLLRWLMADPSRRELTLQRSVIKDSKV